MTTTQTTIEARRSTAAALRARGLQTILTADDLFAFHDYACEGLNDRISGAWAKVELGSDALAALLAH